jgi:hypothetical protein
MQPVSIEGPVSSVIVLCKVSIAGKIIHQPRRREKN